MLASFTSTDSESENPPLGNPLRFRAVENRSNRNRRLAKDFEQTIASATAWLFIASIQLFTRRIARS